MKINQSFGGLVDILFKKMRNNSTKIYYSYPNNKKLTLAAAALSIDLFKIFWYKSPLGAYSRIKCILFLSSKNPNILIMLGCLL